MPGAVYAVHVTFVAILALVVVLTGIGAGLGGAWSLAWPGVPLGAFALIGAVCVSKRCQRMETAGKKPA